MHSIFFLIFRRMRQPLLTLVMTYAIAVLGLTLIPGQDAVGNPWRMDFFHAFYFVSFMATTIGFGEIPYPFTDAQRLWVTFSLYATVVVWIYALGTLLSLVQDKAFQQALTERAFARRIRRIREDFYLICGYGETGGALAYALTERDRSVVVIDIDPDRISMLQLENLRRFIPALHGDAARPRYLLEAGLKHARCKGVVALTNDNEVNLKVAITSKLLHPEIKVICRSDSHDVEENMASFGTDYIINPFDTFAKHLATALQAPGIYLLHHWLTGGRGVDWEAPVDPPAKGRWIVCGYGRFGRAVCHRLKSEGIEPMVIESMPGMTGMPESGFVLGRGTEAKTLHEAGIDQAVGLVAGTDNDANNLSIIMTARELRPELFVILRQNHKENQSIVDAVNADMVMHPSAIIANRIRVLLGTPLLYQFTSLALHQDDAWAQSLVKRIGQLVGYHPPAIWEVLLDSEGSLAVCEALDSGRKVILSHLLADPVTRENTLPVICLLLKRGGTSLMLPEGSEGVRLGDRLLFCGRRQARDRMEWCLQNTHALNYILTGEVTSGGWIWRKLGLKSRVTLTGQQVASKDNGG
ncbi:potassium channel family protein [Sedimenticola sp.]|uniref:potassium channel family protein n=1 Tax=Sedimenticola sp. TaxID=1940285 RepID=UPI003D15113A